MSIVRGHTTIQTPAGLNGWCGLLMTNVNPNAIISYRLGRHRPTTMGFRVVQQK